MQNFRKTLARVRELRMEQKVFPVNRSRRESVGECRARDASRVPVGSLVVRDLEAVGFQGGYTDG
jgi:hypothetical protein